MTSKKTEDDKRLDAIIRQVYKQFYADHILSLPSNFAIELDEEAIPFSEIRQKWESAGIPQSVCEEYYGGTNRIQTDCSMIVLTIRTDKHVERYPLFMAEIKKQGTNDKRLAEGKRKQSQGNAAGDRVAKNFHIAADYCINEDFFPYTIFMHGFDFSETEITTTTLSKLKPFIGTLNELHPFFDKTIKNRVKGGSCFYQGEDFTKEQIFKICYECCKIGIEYYIKKYAPSTDSETNCVYVETNLPDYVYTITK